MRAKLINEIYLDPREEDLESENTYIGFDANDYGTVTYFYSNEPHQGKIEVDIGDIIDYFDLSDEESRNISDETFDLYAAEALNPNDIEWSEE